MNNPFEQLATEQAEIKQTLQRIEERLLSLAPNQSDRLLTREEKVKELDVSYPTLNRWVANGLIECIRVGRRVYFKPGVRPAYQ